MILQISCVQQWNTISQPCWIQYRNPVGYKLEKGMYGHGGGKKKKRKQMTLAAFYTVSKKSKKNADDEDEQVDLTEEPLDIPK